MQEQGKRSAQFSPSPLDPADWQTFRADAHRLLDACIDQLSSARQHPWQPVGEADKAALALGEALEGEESGALVDELVRKVLPFHTGNTHPRFFGWVHGTGLAAGLLAEMVAATMNSNCGGRDHGAVYVEREVIDWCRRCFGFPESASGVLVGGTSQATVIALAAARTRALGAASRRDGIQGAQRLAAYALQGVHNATVKSLELLGVGAAALRTIPAGVDGGMSLERLAEAVAKDRADGMLPFCIVATAGSVDLGVFDDIDAIADFCAREGIWLHVDGAFGAWSRLADSPWRDLSRGIERADSLAFDFHKWMYVQYDCGVVLIRDEAAHRQAFAARPAYLAKQDQGLGGGEPWYCDYGVDLSRGFRALKVWAALRNYGSKALGASITDNCRLAERMGVLVGATPGLRLAAPVRLNVCCFSAAPSDWEGAAQDRLNERITHVLQLAGDVVFSTTRVEGRTVIRAAITNHRTCAADIDEAISAVMRVRCGEIANAGTQ
ncbi:pyridoxal phosphate-dependent decarboxylase family protein [Propionivibrio dicarboxylicus]|uniref:Glutamate or tyrosine decarboxylase n=1 Tax=Propionivibrio dicarboxylicus TaxID=83767 RepID=A0A1G8BRC2_9RHOO|nr:pyridoxal-dependent decarboxylase [Propionivibrio dicarboxylicus]SDH35742.1 Glutamate or tyrosine decarboxylase [Propionivibrio dicarboxylicus]